MKSRESVLRCLVMLAVALAACLPAIAAEWQAKVSIQRYPATIAPGEKAPMAVNISNTGTEDWPVDTIAIVRAIKDNNGNDVRVDTPFSDEKRLGMIPAGTGAGAPDFTLEGALGRGKWTLEVFVQIEGQRIDGTDTCEVEVTAEYYGNFTVRKYPKKVKLGTQLIFEFDVENSGNVEWDPGEVCLNCRLLSAKGDGAMNEGKKLFNKRFDKETNDDTVAPDDDTRFTIKVNAPKMTGEWKLEWQLYDLEEKELFGQKVVGTVVVTPK